MTTAIIGLGNIGKSVARHLVDGDERVVLAARDESNATALARELGELASATSVEKRSQTRMSWCSRSGSTRSRT